MPQIVVFYHIYFLYFCLLHALLSILLNLYFLFQLPLIMVFHHLYFLYFFLLHVLLSIQLNLYFHFQLL
ncbi:hypothetical protein H8356DRAFT_1754395 [Neocallimastix lanati (nom. inval.)]|nr:hypothetical protein H8356DRAFT_1754395 [Neocallimastix sp. JGI-2020a]